MSTKKTTPKYLLISSLGALGVVFGDIGTSPLYAFRETFIAADGLAVNEANVLGILSLMFWALTLVVSVKYLAFVMRADNDGEGGILALTAVATTRRRGLTDRARVTLLTIGLFGTALLYGDGVITPAISVLSAVEGVELITPDLESYVTPVAAAIVVGLFIIQRAGTARVGALFGPVMILWFSTLGLLGIGQVLANPTVLRAISPTYAVQFISDHRSIAFFALGAVVLVVTGSEALYADMGHFGRRPIRLVWFAFVMPALLLNYFGQGALLIANPESVENPFYALVPEWGLIPMIILATMSTVIASQALISGAFSLTLQAVQLGYLPRLKIDHTSSREIGQIYIGTVNYMLMVTCIIIVFAFGSASNLATAYGVAVTTTMLATTIILYVVMRWRWRWNPFLVWGLTVAFLAIDVTFFLANMIKVPHGGWFPLVIGFGILAVMVTWKTGRARVVARIHKKQLLIERFIGSISLHPQARVPGTAVYLFSEVGTTPPALLANLRHNDVLHQTVLIVSIHWTTTPRVYRAARATIHPLGEGFYQVLLKYGFMESPDVPGALSDIATADFGFDPSDAIYVIGKETIIIGKGNLISRLRDRFFALMQRNASSAAQFFGLPTDDVIEVGMQLKL